MIVPAIVVPPALHELVEQSSDLLVEGRPIRLQDDRVDKHTVCMAQHAAIEGHGVPVLNTKGCICDEG